MKFDLTLKDIQDIADLAYMEYEDTRMSISALERGKYSFDSVVDYKLFRNELEVHLDKCVRVIALTDRLMKESRCCPMIFRKN